ncbi:hypothetical protein KBY72_07260 [Cyanobium sp. BA5m-21]|uniref:hypothetical protein n=2 Tax=unclassified Cyanobium TaxID=2627006 RepID=UPI0020CF3B6C|nr:hypothetical protein [Cyanobium sp. BA5m-21]MCP9905518.1 hypothetical protein [Cyanobium sp. BA5m-10]MCP9906976.1 hypothetical protein [Cyanobium sp. BA5m-21]
MNSLRFTAMQLIQLERDDWNFFCPATGEPVFKETGEPNASTVRGFWCHEVQRRPMEWCNSGGSAPA